MGNSNSKTLEIILKATDQTKKGLESTVGGLTGIQKAAGAVGAGMVAMGVMIDKALGRAQSVTKDYVGSVVAVQRMTGLSAEESSKWAAVLDRYGVEGKKAALVIKNLSAEINSNGKNLKAAGVYQNDANVRQMSTLEIMRDLAEYYKNADNKAQALTVVTKALGKGFADLMPILANGAAGFDEITAKAEKFGLVLTQDNIDSFVKYSSTLKDNEQAVKGLEVEVGMATIPMELWKNQTLAGIYERLRDLNPALVQTTVGIAAMSVPVLKVGGGMLGLVAFFPYVKAGLAGVESSAGMAAGSVWGLTKAGAALLGEIAAIAAIALSVDMIFTNLGHMGDTVTEQWQREYDKVDAMGKPLVAFMAGLSGAKIKTVEGATAATLLAGSTRDLGAAMDGETGSSNALTRSLQGQMVAEDSLSGRKRSAAEAGIANKLAQMDYKDAVKNTADALKAHGKKSEEYKRAVLAEKTAMFRARDAAVDYKTAIKNIPKKATTKVVMTGGGKMTGGLIGALGLENLGWKMQSFAGGGVARGPRSGYLAVLHGTERVTPLDGPNSGSDRPTIIQNFTGSALDADMMGVMAGLSVRNVLADAALGG